jgi:hypothetical protein
MTKNTTEREAAEMLAELRDSLVHLSTTLKDLVFETETHRNPQAIDEISRLLESVASPDRRRSGR